MEEGKHLIEKLELPITHAKHSWDIHLEKVRFWGLAAGGVLLILGKIVTNMTTASGLINAGYIFSTYHFRHTCVYLDYNPSRTFSALLVMCQIFPLDFFIIMFYFKVKQMHEAKLLAADSDLFKITKWATPFMFVTQTYFYMVFVNKPDANEFFVPDHENNPTSTDKNTWETITVMDGLPAGFIFHYLPYMFWQAGMILMAIQHNFYLIETDKLKRVKITQDHLYMYNYFIIVAGCVYTLFVWSFILGTPLWDTTTPHGNAAGVFAMYGFDAVVVLVPCIFSGIEAYWLFPKDHLTFTFKT